MSETQKYFEENGYVVLSDALSKEECKQLTQYMFDLHEKGELTKDDQCPQSDAIYGAPALDALLAKFTKPIGAQVGKELLPTYTYARIYRPGEILKKHKDRPSCEISATLTLGFDARYIWPIYFNEDKEISVDLEVGELAVYKGCEVCHWRKPFKGNWHVQVFLHYVDANGPYKDHVNDGRPQLAMSNAAEDYVQETRVEETVESPASDTSVQEPVYHLPADFEFSSKRLVHDAMLIPSNDNTFPGYFGINSRNLPELMFTPQECDKIIAEVEHAYPSTASVGTGTDGNINKRIRSADIFTITNDDEHRWIWNKLGKTISIVNKIFYDYDLSSIEHGLQLIRYDSSEEVKGHYDWHVDAGKGNVATRKLSFTLQLSDPSTYEGCDLLVNDHATPIAGSREQGSINFFPSYMTHKVTPIEKGVRYALVIWVHGSRRFR